MCVTDRHDVTLAVKVVLNPNTTNQPTFNVKTLGESRKSIHQPLLPSPKCFLYPIKRRCHCFININFVVCTTDSLNLVKAKSVLFSRVNSLLHNPDFKRPCIRSLLKTLWEKEKMLVTSIFSFSHNVFYPSKTNFSFGVTFILSSANPFNLD